MSRAEIYPFPWGRNKQNPLKGTTVINFSGTEYFDSDAAAFWWTKNMKTFGFPASFGQFWGLNISIRSRTFNAPPLTLSISIFSVRFDSIKQTKISLCSVIPRNYGLYQLFEVITWCTCCFVNTIIERFENTDDFILFADKFFLGRHVDDDLTETISSFKVHSWKALKKEKLQVTSVLLLQWQLWEKITRNQLYSVLLSTISLNTREVRFVTTAKTYSRGAADLELLGKKEIKISWFQW